MRGKLLSTMVASSVSVLDPWDVQQHPYKGNKIQPGLENYPLSVPALYSQLSFHLKQHDTCFCVFVPHTKGCVPWKFLFIITSLAPA